MSVPDTDAPTGAAVFSAICDRLDTIRQHLRREFQATSEDYEFLRAERSKVSNYDTFISLVHAAEEECVLAAIPFADYSYPLGRLKYLHEELLGLELAPVPNRVDDLHGATRRGIAGRELLRLEAEVSGLKPKLDQLAERVATSQRILARQGRKVPPVKPTTRRKAKTNGNGVRDKLIAALTKHHQYADGSCLNQEPIRNNELAKQAGVQRPRASEFFKKEFKGHGEYKSLCQDKTGLIAALKLLNDEFAPHNLYGRRQPDDGDRDDE